MTHPDRMVTMALMTSTVRSSASWTEPRDRAGIIDRLAEQVADGSFEFQRDGRPVQDRAQARAVLAEWAEASLQRLAPPALLVGV